MSGLKQSGDPDTLPLMNDPEGYGACDDDKNLGTGIDRRAVWGLYCMYAIIGIVYGFTANYITLPICQYVFGPMGASGRTSIQQCNIAPSITQMPWNLKVFYGLILDRVSLFGSRRRGWILFGWTASLMVVIVMSFLSAHLVDTGDFASYSLLWMIACVFYILADVAGDGMTIELSKLEPPETRGYILTTGQMTRFSATILVNLLGTFAMNGESYYAGAKGNHTTFPFELSFGAVHVALVCMVLPFYVGMVLLLKDPPEKQAEEKDHSMSDVIATIWDLMQTKVFLFLILYSLGSMAIGSLGNPASNVIQAIAAPSTLQSSVGNLFGNLLFLAGVAIFRGYFMNVNWRFTFLWTGVLISIGLVFDFITIYDAWGIGQNGWFYALSGSVLQIIQGLAQVLSSLAVIEIAPPGFEATVYEFMTTMHNAGITLNTNLQNIFVPVFNLNDVSAERYFAHNSHRDEFNHRMASATLFTIVINVAGVYLFSYFAPRNRDDCKLWKEDASWRSKYVGAAVLIIGGGCFLFSVVISFLSIFPSTMCMRIAGGDGC